MKRAINLITRNMLWVITGMLMLSFAAIVIQSQGEADEVDLDFVAASKATKMHMGNEDAPVNIVVYTDFLCPFCSNFANDVMPDIEKNFIETGKAQIEVRPVAMIGLDSDAAAEAAFCAADQNQFWPFHDGLYSYVAQNILVSGVNTREESVLPDAVLAEVLTSDQSYDQNLFRDCLVNETHAETVKQATSDAMARGVRGTPYVMINGNHIQGASYEIMASVIKAQL